MRDVVCLFGVCPHERVCVLFARLTTHPSTPSGTNLEQAKHVLQASTMKIIPANDLEEAASKSCNMAQIVTLAKQQHLDVNFSIPI